MATAQSRVTDMTRGDPVRLLLNFSAPLFLSNLLQQFYNLADTALAGHILGDAALAEIGATAALYGLIMNFAFGMNNGLALTVSRLFGAGDEKGVRRATAWMLALAGATAAVLTVVFVGVRRPLLVLLQVPEASIDGALAYLTLILLGIPLTMAYNMEAALLRAIGNSFMPLVFLILSSVLNVILDLWFIAALGMGVAGAGVATVISQGVSVALCILYVFRSARLLLPEKKHFHVESRLYWELFSQSISMGLMSSIVSAGSVVLQYGINGLGTLVIAGHTAARKLFAFTDMPLTAMASACSTYVSQNYGANHPDRVRRGMRDIYLYGVVVAVTAILLMSVGAEWMVKLVSGSSEPVVLENGVRYLVWNAPFYAVLGMLLSTRYALQSMGEKVLPLLSSVIEFLGKIVFVLLFIPRFEYNAVILCEPVIWCFMTIELLMAYRHNSFVFPKMKK